MTTRTRIVPERMTKAQLDQLAARRAQRKDAERKLHIRRGWRYGI